eukprot:13386149-Alexandrium_andersonii.AAC.1
MGPGTWVHRREAKHGAGTAGMRPEQVQDTCNGGTGACPSLCWPPVSPADVRGQLGRAGGL